jgi:predicted RNA polymerase sigma factor
VKSSFEAIEWVFQGFASFYVSPPKMEHRHDTEVNEEHEEEEEEEGEEEEEEGEGEEVEEDHLSENASHLVFAAAPSSPLHPDEMVSTELA